MLWILIYFTSSFLNESIISRNNHFSKQWEYDGSILFQNSILTFNSNQDFPYATAYCTHNFKRTSFTNLTFKIPIEITDFCQFGIWLINDFGSHGILFGGPKTFKGLGILIQILNNQLSVEVRENDINQSLDFSPILQIEPKSQYLNVLISNINFMNNSKSLSNLTISIHNGDYHSTIYSNPFYADLKKRWLGITSLVSSNASAISLESAKIIDSNETDNSTQSIPVYEKERILQTVKLLSDRVQTQNYKPNSSEIVQLLDKMDKVVEYISDDIDLDSILKNAMIPFTQTWQKRSIKISSKIGELAERIKNELDSVESQFESLRKDLASEAREFAKNLSDVESELYFSEVRFEFDYNSKLREEKKTLTDGTPVTKIFLFCLVETIFVLLFFVSSWCDEFQIKLNAKKKPKAFHQRPVRRRKRRKFEA